MLSCLDTYISSVIVVNMKSFGHVSEAAKIKIYY